MVLLKLSQKPSRGVLGWPRLLRPPQLKGIQCRFDILSLLKLKRYKGALFNTQSSCRHPHGVTIKYQMNEGQWETGSTGILPILPFPVAKPEDPYQPEQNWLIG